MDYLSSLLLLCSHVASNFSSCGSSFLFPWPASHGYAVAICSNFLLGLCCHLQVASYLIFHHVIANCCYLSVCAAVLLCSSAYMVGCPSISSFVLLLLCSCIHVLLAACQHCICILVLVSTAISSVLVSCPVSISVMPVLLLSIQVQLQLQFVKVVRVHKIHIVSQPISSFYFMVS